MIQRHAASGGAEHGAGWKPVADLARATSTPMNRASGTIWCHARRRWAVVSAIERRTESGGHRWVQWCSLIGLDVQCDQACLEAFGGARRSNEKD